MDKKNQIVNSMYIGINLTNIEHICLKSFVEMGHSVHLYVYDPVGNVPKGVKQKDASKYVSKDLIYENNVNPKNLFSSFSDIFRYTMLYREGGWWIDTDAYCVKPFDFKQTYIFPTEINWDGEQMPCSGVIKVPPKSEIMRVAISESWKIVRRDQNHEWADIGPLMMGSLVDKLSLKKYRLPYNYFMPFSWRYIEELLTEKEPPSLPENCYSVHFYGSKWSEREKKRPYAKHSAFERLRRGENVWR